MNKNVINKKKESNECLNIIISYFHKTNLTPTEETKKIFARIDSIPDFISTNDIENEDESHKISNQFFEIKNKWK